MRDYDVDQAVQRLKYAAVEHVVDVLERGAYINEGGRLSPILGDDDLSARLRAIRDDLVDLDRLRLLYEPHRRP